MSLQEAIKNRSIKDIRQITKKTPIADIADILESLSTNEIVLYFRLLNTHDSADIFAQLELEYQEKLINSFTNEEAKDIFEDLYLDDIADLIEEVPANIARKILANTPKEKRIQINKLLMYSDDQTGSFMSVDYISLNQSMTTQESLKVIKDRREHAENKNIYFVVDDENHLVGLIDLEEIIFNKEDKPISKIMKATPHLVTTDSDEKASFEFQKHDLPILPVLSTTGYLVGIVTADDIFDVISKETTEDIQTMAGMEALDTPYLRTTILRLVRSRVFWLLLLMISATLSQIVLDTFTHLAQRTLDKTSSTGGVISATLSTSLVSIIPVIAGASGNAGSQSSTMITRSLAVNEIMVKDYKKVLWKEMRIGFVVGAILAISNFVRLIIYYSIKNHDISKDYLWISIGASIALWVVILVAKIVGGLLPLIAKALKQDPAVMAAPLLTTMLDALSSLIFFSLNIGILLLVLKV